ncbi:SusC/RagA family TonB-linked outer membrane protein [Bacteroides heparinolyticus]|uniref:SusC/RagA family TonB-linked outer membrane protein n=2 Tax=Prevotella heparinolytica TaxID=28113 RepID=UPI0023F68757|nr:TonB-dependent receptor [Bacteroides heparinolyticus]MCI6212873.1 TonB-dependent receptor [Bacteroides heparinolyticus]
MRKFMENNAVKRLVVSVAFLLMCIPFMLAQGLIKVTGRITDELNEPMIGVSVLEKGTANGAITDIDGNYSLSVKEGATIVYSYIGYLTQEKKAVAGVMDVILKEDSKTLDEVVVVGYGVQKKSSVTGAISQVKAEDMENRTISNASQALQGKTAGVQLITTSSAPGSTPTVRVRGFSSNESSNPLYVVDGVRMSDIGGLDPNNIASMEVLKDAASAAIYGAEAGNGVILISTKKGKAGQGKITYDFQFATQSISHMPKLLNSEEYIQYMSEGNILAKDFMETNWDGKTNTNWLDIAFEDSRMAKHNLAFTGGGEQGNYYLALTYLDNDGIVKGKNDTYQRMTATVNAEYNIKPWLKVGTTNQIEKYNVRNVSSQNAYGSFLQAVLMMDPLTPDTYASDQLPTHMKNALSQGSTLLKDENGRYYGSSLFYVGENYHPTVMRESNISRNSGFNVNGSIYADFKPIKGLTVTSRFGYLLGGKRSSTTNLPFYGNTNQKRNYVNVSGQSSTNIYYQWENFANYMKSFGGHTINAMAGMSFQESTYDYVSAGLEANGENAVLQNNPLFYYLNYASSSAVKSLGGEKTRSAKMSYFGRVSYDYLGRYMAQFSLRADAADLSQLPISNRWGYFPAASVGWTVSEEKFFAPLQKHISSLKMRVSWGQNGSLSALGGYSYGTDMTSSGIYPLGAGNSFTSAVSPSSLGNDNLRWETSEQTNIGLDARFLRDRLNFSVDYFNKKTKDLLVWNTTPSLVIGGSTSPINAGNVSNKGWEFELGWRDRVKDFNYSVRGSLATLKNEVTYIDRSLSRIAGTAFHTYTLSYFEKGYPVYYFRGYKFKGLDAEGNPTFHDLDNSGNLSDGDLTYIGDAIPDFTYGVTLTAAWKGFDLTVFGTGSYGNEIYHCYYRPDYSSSNRLKDIFYDNRWTAENPNGTVPRAGAKNMDQYVQSDAMVYDGSFFRVKQIQLGYTLPKSLLKKVFVNNLRVYCSLDDFITFSSYPGFDPESSANATKGMGIDMGGYPASKKVVLGFNIEF